MAEERCKEKIRVLLSENGYPANIIVITLQISEQSPRRREQTRNNACVAVKLPFGSDSLDKKIRGYIQKSKLPICVIYEHAYSIKKTLVRSALVPNHCIVHEKYLEQQQGTKRRGRPRDDCLACQAGLSSSLYDQKGDEPISIS